MDKKITIKEKLLCLPFATFFLLTPSILTLFSQTYPTMVLWALVIYAVIFSAITIGGAWVVSQSGNQ